MFTCRIPDPCAMLIAMIVHLCLPCACPVQHRHIAAALLSEAYHNRLDPHSIDQGLPKGEPNASSCSSSCHVVKFRPVIIPDIDNCPNGNPLRISTRPIPTTYHDACQLSITFTASFSGARQRCISTTAGDCLEKKGQ